MVPDIPIFQVDLVVWYHAVKLFLKGCRMRKVCIAARSHVSTDHDTIDGLRRIGHRHINNQYLLAILAQDIPDRLPSFASRLHMSLTSSSTFLLLIISPE